MTKNLEQRAQTRGRTPTYVAQNQPYGLRTIQDWQTKYTNRVARTIYEARKYR